MTDSRAKLLRDLIRPLRVEPGSKVRLPKDFDPGYKAGFLHKSEGDELLHRGVELLKEYQPRLAAQETTGCSSCCSHWMPAARTERSGT